MRHVNLDSISYSRLSGSEYWYCRFAEYLSYPAYKNYKKYSMRKGLQALEQKYFRCEKQDNTERFTRQKLSFPELMPSAVFDSEKKYIAS